MYYFNLSTIIIFYYFLCKYDLLFFSHCSIYFNLKNTLTTLSKCTAKYHTVQELVENI